MHAPSPPTPAPARPRVLIVEDDELAGRGYARTLSGDFEVRLATSGSEALAAIREQAFSAVVSDVDLPELSGIELLKAIRATDLDLPFLVVTGHPSLESAQDAVNLGALSYLTKPVDPKKLREDVKRACTLRSLLQLQRSAREVRDGGAEPSDRAGLEVHFEAALARLWIAFQPIISTQERAVIGYEALVRTDEPALRNPAVFIEHATRLGRLLELGRLIRAQIAREIPSAPSGARIFVNLHPHELEDEELFDPDSPLARHAKRVVLEVTERASLETMSDLVSRCRALRGLGYRIAIDDLGAGYAGLSSLPKLEPEVVKIDMSLVRGVDTNRTQQQLIASMARACADLGITVITEGVETPAERDTLVSLGCDLLQGYLFGRPSRGFVPASL